MNKISAFLLLALISLSCVAQETPEPEKKEKKKRKPPRKEFLLVNLNFDHWLFTPSTIEPKWFASRGVDIAVFYDQVIARSNFSVGAGLGFNSHNIHMEGFPIEYAVESGETYTHLDPSFFDGKDINVNKISTNFVDIPVEIRFRSHPRKNGKRIAASVGFKLGWLVQSHTKTKTNQDLYFNGVNFRDKIKTYDIPNLTTFRYGVTARVGYAKFYVNFFYSLTPLFVDGRGTNAVPISIGIGYSPL
ncbi:MAG: outer membrane beta-barrel protein [Flavobacteriales bacterium]